jgi:hypothetical protein
MPIRVPHPWSLLPEIEPRHGTLVCRAQAAAFGRLNVWQQQAIAFIIVIAYECPHRAIPTVCQISASLYAPISMNILIC